ncbi:MAG: UvrD-helicase domain-containing protein [Bacteriovoracaceae bacterium]|nr:UvrD-helicase domain-containing protein [Bacteriovoracaceae bacterium]
MSERTPNPEQLKAIKHTGGVILSAGAGSGKTFVIIEHLIHLINEFDKKIKSSGEDEYRRRMTEYLTSIVVMTFTRKAAGELKIRLQNRISGINGARWEITKDIVDKITVTTIHGFCHKLLSSGYITDCSAKFEIIGDLELRGKIGKFFKLWCLGKKDERNPAVLNVLNHHVQVGNAINDIFLSSELRLMWRDIDPQMEKTWGVEDYFVELLSALNLLDIFKNGFSLEDCGEYSAKKWYQFIEKFNKTRMELLDLRPETMHQLAEYFATNKYRMPAAKDAPDSAREFFKRLNILKKFIKDNQEHYLNYSKGHDGAFREWLCVFKEIFDFVDDLYDSENGKTFSDLEFYVLNGLKNNGNDCERIGKNFRYFIVDEFQDTSNIQWEIIQLLIGEKYDRLFAVGDIKQAIYGFRGGELGVFKKCLSEMSNDGRLTLRNNYRSSKSVITFNNKLFDYVFPLGEGYTGFDYQTVPGEPQEYPGSSGDDNNGEVVSLDFQLIPSSIEKNKLSADEINYYEALSIREKIREISTRRPGESICILYRKMNPALFLVSLLLDDGESFVSQIKIPMNEDPVWGMFQVLLECRVGFREVKNQKQAIDKYGNFILGKYLESMKISTCLQDAIDQFQNDILFMGLFESFRKFLFVLGISNSNYSNNMKNIQSVCQISKDDPEEALYLMNEKMDQKYTTEFQTGSGDRNIHIMSCHASKGLEFDHVILGGILTNGATAADRSFIGKYPASIRWKLDENSEKPAKSPNLILENIARKKKEFSESKRLFYVACTRAKNSLSWVDISLNSEPSISNKNSWILAVRNWSELQRLDGANDIISNISRQEKYECDSQLLNRILNNPPFFHRDKLGMQKKAKDDFNRKDELAIMSELSVTRLATIADCPRKFFLLNVCKLSQEDVKAVTGKGEDFSYEVNIEDETIDDMEEVNQKIRSSSERGTKIHYMISEVIRNSWKIPDAMVANKEEIQILDWIKSKLKIFDSSHDFISEEVIKFPLFGYMLSGIPDLVLKPKETAGEYIIWDFKTGSRKKHEKSYWFQLFSYARAMFDLNSYPEENVVELVLCYLDEKKLITKKVNYKDIDEYLASEWKKLARFDLFNSEHCAICNYGKLCLLSCTP